MVIDNDELLFQDELILYGRLLEDELNLPYPSNNIQKYFYSISFYIISIIIVFASIISIYVPLHSDVRHSLYARTEPGFGNGGPKYK